MPHVLNSKVGGALSPAPCGMGYTRKSSLAGMRSLGLHGCYKPRSPLSERPALSTSKYGAFACNAGQRQAAGGGALEHVRRW